MTTDTTPPLGLLLVNLGTPDKPEPKEVRAYLREFLMDPYVIDLPWLMRALLVHGVVLRVRPRKSAESYKKVWTEKGSPLLTNLQGLVREVQSQVDQKSPGCVVVQGAMRYGNPSISAAIQAFAKAGVREVRALPLYPQMAGATTLTTFEALAKAFQKLAPGMDMEAFGDFYAESAFIDPSAKLLKEALEKNQPDHVVFSFHSLPVRHITRANASRTCLKSADCCAEIAAQNAGCYRAQCFASARSIAAGAGLDAAKYSIAFQSRVGTAKWIGPEFVGELKRLAEKGIKRVAVACPSFVADCLETIEEIGMRGAESFKSFGGEELSLVPCLNDRPDWAAGVIQLLEI